MRIKSALFTMAAGAMALAAAYAGSEPPPAPPACVCNQVNMFGPSCGRAGLGTATENVCCFVGLNGCFLSGSITWTPANPQTCTWTAAEFNEPRTPFNAATQQTFSPVANRCGPNPPGTFLKSNVCITGIAGTNCGASNLVCEDAWRCDSF